MAIDITQVIVAIIGVVGTIFAGAITSYVIPWLKSKLTANQLDVVSALVYSGVKAAETLYTDSGSGDKKFQYVMDTVEAFCNAHHIAFDEATVKNEIQSAWKDLFSDNSTDASTPSAADLIKDIASKAADALKADIAQSGAAQPVPTESGASASPTSGAE